MLAKLNEYGFDRNSLTFIFVYFDKSAKEQKLVQKFSDSVDNIAGVPKLYIKTSKNQNLKFKLKTNIKE